MYYVLSIIGIIIIFIAFKTKDIKDQVDYSEFNATLKQELNENENNLLADSVSKLTVDMEECLIRLKNIEESIIYIDDKNEKNINVVMDSMLSLLKKHEYTEDEQSYTKEEKDDNKVENTNTSLDICQNSINDDIARLYNEGKSLEEISSTLRIGKGEVLLRIGLIKQRTQC